MGEGVVSTNKSSSELPHHGLAQNGKKHKFASRVGRRWRVEPSTDTTHRRGMRHSKAANRQANDYTHKPTIKTHTRTLKTFSRRRQERNRKRWVFTTTTARSHTE